MINLAADLDQGAEKRPCDALPWEQNPYRLWSLLEMIKVLLSKYLNIGINIEGARWSYHTTEMYDFLHMTGSQKANLSAVIQPKLRYTIDELKRLCDELNLSTSYDLLCSIGDEIPETEREYMIYVTAIYAELNSKLFLYIPSHRATYYESENILSDGAKQ